MEEPARHGRLVKDMELVTILRELAARRRLVVVCVLLALLLGTLTAFKVSPSGLKSRQYSVGVASTRVLVDTSASQIYDLGDVDNGAGSLEGRSSLLANVMGSEPVEKLISQRLGISEENLVVLLPVATSAPVQTPLAEQAAKASQVPGTYVLTVQSDSDVSIIYVDAEAPNAAAAAKLADVSVTSLHDYVDQLGANSNIPPKRRVVVSRSSAVSSSDVKRGTGPIMGFVVAFVVFFAGMCAIVVGSGLVRAWRQGPMPATAGAPVRRPLPPGVRPQRPPGLGRPRPAPLTPPAANRPAIAPGREPTPRRLPASPGRPQPRPTTPEQLSDASADADAGSPRNRNRDVRGPVGRIADDDRGHDVKGVYPNSNSNGSETEPTRGSDFRTDVARTDRSARA